jgi:hypothetical protein
MRIPTRFFLSIFATFAVAFAIFEAALLGQFGSPSKGSAWTVRIIQRKTAAARAVNLPKLLIVGGSGGLFGVKARQLESTLGIPAVNLCSHAGIGTACLLELPRLVATHGDTVIIIPEYELYDYGDTGRLDWGDAQYLDYMMAAEPARLRQLSSVHFALLTFRVPAARILEGWLARLHPPAPRTFSSYHPYDPANVDDHGDMTGHRADRIPARSLGPVGISETLAFGLTPRRSGMRDLRAFVEWAKMNGIRVLAAFPVLCEQPAYSAPATARTIHEIQAFWRELGVPLLGQFHDTLLPRRNFFDTEYHLTEEAAAFRTSDLASQIAPYLRKQVGD